MFIPKPPLAPVLTQTDRFLAELERGTRALAPPLQPIGRSLFRHPQAPHPLLSALATTAALILLCAAMLAFWPTTAAAERMTCHADTPAANHTSTITPRSTR